MTKRSSKELSISLREAGYSYNLIAEKVRVSKSTLSVWLANIAYTPNKEVIGRIGNSRAAATVAKYKQKKISLEKAKQLATIDVGSCSERDQFMFGLALYVGEGEKNNNVGIINANPLIIATAKSWLMKFYDVPETSFTLAIHLYPDTNLESALEYWSRYTRIPLTQFGKTQIDRRHNKKTGKRGKLPYGTAHLRVRAAGNKSHGVLLSRRIQAAADIILSQHEK
jgi:hypothetical protein